MNLIYTLKYIPYPKKGYRISITFNLFTYTTKIPSLWVNLDIFVKNGIGYERKLSFVPTYYYKRSNSVFF